MKFFKFIRSLFTSKSKKAKRDRYCLKKLENYLATGCRSVADINKFLGVTSGRTYITRLRKKGVPVEWYWCSNGIRQKAYKRYFVCYNHE